MRTMEKNANINAHIFSWFGDEIVNNRANIDRYHQNTKA